MAPPTQKMVQRKAPKPWLPQPQKPPPSPLKPRMVAIREPVMPLVQRPAPASWTWIRPSGSGRNAQARPYRSTPMPAKRVRTMKRPRTINGSIPMRWATPLETPPIQRSWPRLMPWLRTQPKKSACWPGIPAYA
jgi:hypothetical protein